MSLYDDVYHVEEHYEAWEDDSYYDSYPDLTPKEPVWNPLQFNQERLKEKVVGDLDTFTKIFVKARETLKRYAIRFTQGQNDWKVIGREVGDDRVDLSRNPLLLAVAEVVQSEVFGMKTSRQDTFISNRYWNFCETTSDIPCALEQSIHHAKKENFKNLGFVDSPAVRLIINCQKGDRSHSSTAVGKCAMLGAKIRDSNPKHSLILQIASFIQDACLNTIEMKEPKYMHNIMGGCGVPDLFGNYRNTYTYMKNFKHGTYDRVYGTATNEVRDTISKLDMGFPAEAHLCQRLRQKQEYLHGTYANKVLIPPTNLGKVDEDGRFPDPIYNKAGTSSSISGVELRLVRTKRLLPESSARIEWDKTLRLESVIMGVNHVHSTESLEKVKNRLQRKRFGDALNANTAFAHLINRTANGTEVQVLIDEGFIAVNTGVLRFSREDAKWLSRGGKGEAFTINDIPVSENMYLWDEVSREKTMKIPGLSLKPVFSGKPQKTVVTVAKVGLWQINGDMEQWADRIVDRMLSEREVYGKTLPYGSIRNIFFEDREWVSDDTALIRRAAEDAAEEVISQCVILVSSDKRLAHQMAITTANHVVRIEPAPLILKLGLTTVTATTQIPLSMVRDLLPVNFFAEKMIREPVRLYIDTGSCEAELRNISKEALVVRRRLMTGYFHNELRSYDSDGVRSCSIEKFLLDTGAFMVQGQVNWPNTIKMDFTATLSETTLDRTLLKKQQTSVPRKLWRKFYRN